MNYNYQFVSSITGCDEMITQGQREREILTIKRDRIVASVNSALSSRTIAEQDLAAVTQDIADLTAIIQSLPVGSEERLSKEIDLNELEGKQMRLTRDLLHPTRDRQFDLGECEALIANLDVYIAALEARKVELQNA